MKNTLVEVVNKTGKSQLGRQIEDDFKEKAVVLSRRFQIFSPPMAGSS